MTDREIVLAKWKDAKCCYYDCGSYHVFSTAAPELLVGVGKNEELAWADAARRIREEENGK